MLDGTLRLVLLIMLVLISIRGLWTLHSIERLGRRWAIYSMMPAQALLMWFYTENLLTRPFVRPVPTLSNSILRAAIFMVIIGWFVTQEVILMSEQAEHGHIGVD